MGSRTPAIGLNAAACAQVGDVVPGLAVIAVDADGVRLERAFGSADLGRCEDMTSESVCNWFSMTKLVTATAVAQLADDGRLDLDAPVIDSYEPLTMLRPAERGATITARHLLAHSSGLGNPMPLRWVHRADQSGPDRSPLRRTSARTPPPCAVRPRCQGCLHEPRVPRAGRVDHERLRRAVRGLRAFTRAGAAQDDEHRLHGHRPGSWATPYQRRVSALGALSPVLIPRDIRGPRHGRFRALRHFYVDGAAYGGLVGPASDAARFLRAHVCDGELDGVRILSTNATRTMRTIVAHGRTDRGGNGVVPPWQGAVNTLRRAPRRRCRVLDLHAHLSRGRLRRGRDGQRDLLRPRRDRGRSTHRDGSVVLR